MFEWFDDTIIFNYSTYLIGNDNKNHLFDSLILGVDDNKNNNLDNTYKNYLRGSDYDFKELETIYFPANIGNYHWCLFVYKKLTNTIYYYDSMDGAGIETINKFVKKIKKFIENKNIQDNSDNIQLETVDVPKQTNGYDCGVYVTAYIHLLYKGFKLDCITPENITKFRNIIGNKFIELIGGYNKFNELLLQQLPQNLPQTPRRPKETALTLGVYRNNNNSCFFASLWALMHQPINENLFLKELKNSKANNNVSNDIRANIIEYYNHIHHKRNNNTEDFNKFLTDFRNFLQENVKDIKWKNDQQAADEVLNLLITSKFEINNYIEPKERSSYNISWKPEPDSLEKLNDLRQQMYIYYSTYDFENKNFIISNVGEEFKSPLPIFLDSVLDKKTFSYIKENNYLESISSKSEVTNLDSTKNLQTTNNILYNPQFFCIYINRLNLQSQKSDDPYDFQEDFGGDLHLISIVCHSGNASSGHYVCYFFHKNNWYLFDDMRSKIVKIENINTREIKKHCVLLYYSRNLIDIDESIQSTKTKSTKSTTTISQKKMKKNNNYNASDTFSSITDSNYDNDDGVFMDTDFIHTNNKLFRIKTSRKKNYNLIDLQNERERDCNSKTN